MDFHDSLNVLHKRIQLFDRCVIKMFSIIDTLKLSSEIVDEMKNFFKTYLHMAKSSDGIDPSVVKGQLLPQFKMMNVIVTNFDLINKKCLKIHKLEIEFHKISKLIEKHLPSLDKHMTSKSTTDIIAAKKREDALRRKYNNKYRYLPKYMEMTKKQCSTENGMKSVDKDVPN